MSERLFLRLRRFQYRPWIDVSFPLLPHHYCFDAFTRRNTKRTVLFSFKVRPVGALLCFASNHACLHVCMCSQGTIWPKNLGVPPFDVRRHLLSLHNGDSAVVVPTNDTVYDYEDLMATSTFCLVPRGGACHSHSLCQCVCVCIA